VDPDDVVEEAARIPAGEDDGEPGDQDREEGADGENDEDDEVESRAAT
jgi:hypothetical protein